MYRQHYEVLIFLTSSRSDKKWDGKTEDEQARETDSDMASKLSLQGPLLCYQLINFRSKEDLVKTYCVFCHKAPTPD